jgi:hypothetical protein
MNYIQRLRTEAAELQARIDATAQELAEFRAHLLGPKFQASDNDPDRRDWIATGDVLARLSNMRDTLQGMA